MTISIDSAATVWLTTRQLAERLSMSTITLEVWRMKGIGPSYRKLGSSAKAHVRYNLADVVEWENSHALVVHDLPGKVGASA